MSHRQSIHFEDSSAFQVEYDRNISNGGAFFPSDAAFELREIIEVELDLRFCSERIALEAEVVHAGGGNVAVQFLLPASELRSRLEGFLPGPGAAPATNGALASAPPPVREAAPLDASPADDGGACDSDAFDHDAFDADALDSEYLDADEGVDRSAFASDVDDVPFSAPEGQAMGASTGDDDFEIGGGDDGGFDPDEISSDDLASVLGDDEGIAAASTDAARPDAGAPLEPFEPATDPSLAPLPDTDPASALPEVMAELTDPALKVTMDPPAPPATEAAGDPLDDVDDRREAPRSKARVPARLVTTNLDLSGRTRDLSQSGVLVSTDGTDLPVGRKVRLELQHPESGRPIEVRGRVSRHVEGEGTVAAVGISFEDTGDEGLAAFVEEVRQNEERQVESGITGVIQELGMANLIQMLGQSSPLGTLTASHGSEEGIVAFEHGQLRYAQLGGLSGVKALARMLSWDEGAFEFRAHVDPITDEDEPQHLEMAILEAVRQLDEAKLADAPRFRGDQTFRIDREALGAQSGLPKAEEAVLDLATAGFTVRRILDVIPESDAQVFEALTSLAEAGILLPNDDG